MKDSVAVAMAFICGVSAQMPQDYNINRQELDVLFRVFDETGEGCQHIQQVSPWFIGDFMTTRKKLKSAASFSVLPCPLSRHAMRKACSTTRNFSTS